jgi:hypothetical protein
MADVIPLDEFERKAQREQETSRTGVTRACAWPTVRTSAAL